MKYTLLTFAACLCLLFAFGAQADEAPLPEPVEPACQSSDLVLDAVQTEMPEISNFETKGVCNYWTETDYQAGSCGSCSLAWGDGIRSEKRTRSCVYCTTSNDTRCDPWSGWSYHGCSPCP